MKRQWLIAILSLTFAVYTLYFPWEFLTTSTVNAVECRGLDDATDCLQRASDRASEGCPWWRPCSAEVILPAGTYRTTRAIEGSARPVPRGAVVFRQASKLGVDR